MKSVRHIVSFPRGTARPVCRAPEVEEHPMRGIGGCIALILVGAILTFASDWKMEGVNLDVVGLLMMGVGILGLAVYASVLRRRRVSAVVPVVEETRERP
ncbi:hypothetical protein GCM10009731_33080 [Streptomyces globosus]